MAATLTHKHLILPIAPLAAGVIGVLTAAMFALVPTDLLESMVVDSGIASVLSVAEPPLGFTARLLLVLLCGGGVGAIAWFGLFLTFGARTVVLQRSRGGGDAPVLRRADSHPDAPARRPLFANTDLGTPFLEVRARPVHVPVHVDAAAVEAEPLPVMVEPVLIEQPLPTDLDQPLAAYDPAAVPDEPLDWFPPPADLAVAERRQTFDPGERFETFPLTPMVRPTPEVVTDVPPPPLTRPESSETIHALLDRLERVAASRREAAPAPPPAAMTESIEDSLAALRRMATR